MRNESKIRLQINREDDSAQRGIVMVRKIQLDRARIQPQHPATRRQVHLILSNHPNHHDKPSYRISQTSAFHQPLPPPTIQRRWTMDDGRSEAFQQPVSQEEFFSGSGLPLQTIEVWRTRYNRCYVPIINDDTFDQLVIDTSKSVDAGEVEGAIEAFVRDKNTSSDDVFNDARDDVLMPGLKAFETDEQKGAFLTILEDSVAVHDIRFFVATCLPFLLSRGGHRHTNSPQIKTKIKKKTKVQPGVIQTASRVQKRSLRGQPDSDSRRSLRIANQGR